MTREKKHFVGHDSLWEGFVKSFTCNLKGARHFFVKYLTIR